MRKRDWFAMAVIAGVLWKAIWTAVDAVHMLPPAASVEATYVDDSFHMMFAVTIPIFAIMIAALGWTLWTGRKRTGEGPAIHGSKGGLVESAWLLVSLGLTLGLAAYGSREFLLIRGSDKADLDIQITASQWSWEFNYPAAHTVTSELYLPKGKRVRLLMTAQDVVHSFWVPEFRLKQDLVPGRITKMIITPTIVGEYTLRCSELCGRDHSIMTARVKVLEPKEFEKALKQENW